MHAAKLGMKEFVVRAPKEYFHLEDDCFFTVDFHDMYRLLRHKDLDMAQVTLFSMEVITPLLRYMCVHYDQTNNAMTTTCACRMQSYIYARN